MPKICFQHLFEQFTKYQRDLSASEVMKTLMIDNFYFCNKTLIMSFERRKFIDDSFNWNIEIHVFVFEFEPRRSNLEALLLQSF